jgi:hypothetical protein
VLPSGVELPLVSPVTYGWNSMANRAIIGRGPSLITIDKKQYLSLQTRPQEVCASQKWASDDDERSERSSPSFDPFAWSLRVAMPPSLMLYVISDPPPDFHDVRLRVR